MKKIDVRLAASVLGSPWAVSINGTPHKLAKPSSGPDVPSPASAISQVWRWRTMMPSPANAFLTPPVPRHLSRTVAAIAAANTTPAAATSNVAVRQSDASITRRNGAWPNTPPAMPMAIAPPDRMAKRLAGNHWPATAMEPTRLKAAEAPIRKRPAVTAASVVPVAKSTQPPAQIRAEVAISRRGPKRSSRRPTGICMPA